MEELVKLEDVWVSYNGLPVLEGINFSVGENEFIGLIGPNGGGKTTLLRVILGLIKPDRGRVLIMDRPPGQSRGAVGYVSQKAPFDRSFPISVGEVVLMGRYSRAGLFQRYSAADKQVAEKTLKMVGMWEYQNRQIGQLSGGQQQRVFIARSLVTSPRLLLLDEPMESIDPAMQTEFYELLRALSRQMSIVLVSHNISALSIYVENIACLNHRLYYHGSKEVGPEVLEATYKCPVQFIAHGAVPHRVLKEHKEPGD